MRWGSAAPSRSAFYAFPDIRAFGLCSEEFCLRLIAEAGVAAVPGSCFGTEGISAYPTAAASRRSNAAWIVSRHFWKSSNRKEELDDLQKQEVAQMKQKTLFRGIATALATPMTSSGAIDYDATADS